MPHKLVREQIFDQPKDKIWDFIKRPSNLNRITPDDLKFEIITEVPEVMYNGLLIEYRIKLPILGRTRWVTEILEISDGESFVDTQKVGPYKLWHHRHELFEISESKTKMVDTITYEMPFGPLGAIVHSVSVKRQLSDIFNYRFDTLEKLFA